MGWGQVSGVDSAMFDTIAMAESNFDAMIGGTTGKERLPRIETRVSTHKRRGIYIFIDVYIYVYIYIYTYYIYIYISIYICVCVCVCVCVYNII